MKIIVLLLLVTSCVGQLSKPLVYKYADSTIKLDLAITKVKKSSGLYYGDLTIKNLSNDRIIASRSDLKICLKGNRGERFQVIIDSVVPIFYNVAPHQSSEYKVYIEAQNLNIDQGYSISVANRIFDKSAQDILISISKCD